MSQVVSLKNAILKMHRALLNHKNYFEIANFLKVIFDTNRLKRNFDSRVSLNDLNRNLILIIFHLHYLIL